MSIRSVAYCFSKVYSTGTIEQLDIALMSTVFDQQVELVFVDDGVRLLSQISKSRADSPFARALESLRMMEDVPVIVDAESLAARNIDLSSLPQFARVEESKLINESLRSKDLAVCF